jgi:hypothetical protein
MKKVHIYIALTLLLIVSNPHTSKAGWWDDFIDAVTSIWQPVWGKYTEGGSTNKNAPLTTFNRNPDVYWEQREKIRFNVKLLNDKLYYKHIYSDIYNNAKTGNENATCPGGQSVCSLAKLAKDAAFVYLMGFDDNGLDLDSTTGVGRNDRHLFHDKAVTILKKWAGTYGGFNSFDLQIGRANELIQLLQAHDYMVTAKSAGLTYSDDDYETARDILADFTYDLYSEANNDLPWNVGALDRYNNLTLIVASAVGMSAVILSDKQTYWWRVQNKPERWANAAHAYINWSVHA